MIGRLEWRCFRSYCLAALLKLSDSHGEAFS